MNTELDKGCMIVEHNATKFHSLIRPLIANSSATIGAYTFKDRIKPWHVVREKVLRKRAGTMPNYDPMQVKDCSGFRIVCLFNADIPKVLDLVIRSIDVDGEKYQIAKNNIKEIEIHSNRKSGDPLSIVSDVESVVDKWNLQHVMATQSARVPFSSYSSVHIILEIALAEGGSEISAACEIQIRSVFEEAWSEISHRLGYGPDKRAEAERSTLEPSGSSPGAARWKQHLDALKSLADGCAQYSDLIAAEAGHDARPSSKAKAPRSLDPSQGGWPEFYRTLPTEYFKRLQQAFNDRDAAEELAREKQREPMQESSRAAFSKAAQAFEEILLVCQAGEIPTATPDQINGIRAETAYCLMHSAVEGGLEKAELLWRQVLEVNNEFVPALSRLAQVLFEKKDYDEARDLLERAEKLTISQTSVPVSRKDGMIHNDQRTYVIQRDLGLVRWRLSEEQGMTTATRIGHLEASAEAFIKAFDISVTDDQKKTAGTNALYCVAELQRQGPQHAGNFLKKCAEILLEFRTFPDYGNWSDSSRWTTNKLDNLMRAEDAFGDQPAALAIASEVIGRFSKRFEEIAAPSLAAAFDSLSADDKDIYLTANHIHASGQKGPKPR